MPSVLLESHLENSQEHCSLPYNDDHSSFIEFLSPFSTLYSFCQFKLSLEYQLYSTCHVLMNTAIKVNICQENNYWHK